MAGRGELELFMYRDIGGMLYLSYPFLWGRALSAPETGVNRLVPGKLWSLWDMISAPADRLHYLISSLSMLETVLSLARWQAGSGPVGIDMYGATGPIDAEFDAQIAMLDSIGLEDSAAILASRQDQLPKPREAWAYS